MSKQLVDDIVSSNKLLNTDQLLIKSDHAVTSSTDAKSSTLFPIILCIMYIIFKINQIYNTFNELVQSTRELFLDMVKKFLLFFVLEIQKYIQIIFLFIHTIKDIWSTGDTWRTRRKRVSNLSR